MTDPAVASVAAYLPRGRLSADEVADALGSFEARGVESTAVPAADEDALTMAAAASERALAGAGVAGSALSSLSFATTTPPLEEEDLSVRLGSMLGVDETASHHVFTGSTRAGTRALWTALDARGNGPALVVAADCPRGEPDSAFEHAGGAGAAAVVLTADGSLSIADRAEYASPYPGSRFRERGATRLDGIDVRQYDREAFVEPCVRAVQQLDVDRDDVDAVVVHSPDGDLPYRVADALAVDRDAVVSTVETVGDCGAASVAVTLARALDAGYERVLAIGHASGAGADAFVFDGECDVVPPEGQTTDLDYATALRRRGDLSGSPPDGGGAYVSVPSWRQSLPQRHRLVAGRCPDCGALAYPPGGACRACNALVEFEPVELPAAGNVETVTTIGDGSAPPEFAQLQARAGELQVAVVAFDVGDESVSVPLQVATDSEPVERGDRVETTVRLLYAQEGVPRYARKATAAQS